MSWFQYSPRPSVAQLRKQAEAKVRQLQLSGIKPDPVVGLSSRGKIASSFWGHGWCRHLEEHCDYENRLPRGRSYVRNGAVVHLDIDPGEVNALVLGSELYELSIRFDPLESALWDSIQADCRGKIGSLIELLQGRLSDDVMDRVTHPEKGLFPQPGEMHFNCNCPDWADMCKHVAATLYGIGARLDSAPELLFQLRGVDHNDLIGEQTSTDALVAGSRASRRRTLDNSAIHDVFGIEADGLENVADDAPLQRPKRPRKASQTTPKKSTVRKNEQKGKRVPKPAKKKKPIPLTGAVVRSMRESISLNKSSFARVLGVTPTTLARWEKVPGELNVSAANKAQLRKLQKEIL